MIGIQTYQGLKGFITQFAMSEPGIRQLIWGETKRMLDAQSGSEMQYPYLHVEDVQLLARSYQEDTQRFIIWQLQMSIAGSADQDNIEEQEGRMDECGISLWNLLIYLIDQALQERIYFDIDSFSAYADQVQEISNTWGWTFTLRIGVDTHACEKPSAAQRYEVATLLPVYSGTPGDIAIEVGGELFVQGWTSDIPVSQLLVRMVASLTAEGVIASTDGSYLYLMAPEQGADMLIYDTEPAGNTHSWTLLYV